jgi:CRISPR-associated endonuclease Cas1
MGHVSVASEVATASSGAHPGLTPPVQAYVEEIAEPAVEGDPSDLARSGDCRPPAPQPVTTHNGTLVLSGYGLSVRVERGRLEVRDGIGPQRREGRLHRATSGLRRLVVLGHTGSISLEAIRWLSDVGASYLQLDADGRVLAAFGAPGSDRPSLRRAQARAAGTSAGDAIARRLIESKLGGQLRTLGHLRADVADAEAAINEALGLLGAASGDMAIRLLEARAAASYWAAWSPVPVRFARRDASSVPAHWLTFGSRTSPLTGGPRLAANPANAILNYLYALLEAETVTAARVVGLDPGLGFLHADQSNRDSLAADLMEPVRPLVDRYVLEVLGRRTFAARDFFETREGTCRLTPGLAKELAGTCCHWGRLVGEIAEDVAAELTSGSPRGRRLPTPLTGRNRSAGRPSSGGVSRVTRRPDPPAVARACSICGVTTTGNRRTCGGTCLGEVRDAVGQSSFASAGVARLAILRSQGEDPAHSAGARAKVGATQARRRREEEGWDAEHPERPDPALFREQVLPALEPVSISRIARVTGLSLAYCARIKRGETVPHARWWEMLRVLAKEA